MNILALDFETYFDGDYTLKKLTTEQYIRHPRFEAHGCGLLPAATPAAARFYPAAELAAVFGRIDWPNTAVLCHHAQFDGLILSHHYGVVPGFWFDTMSMGRAALGNHVRVSLSSLAKLYGLPEKTVPYDEMRGRRWINMDVGTRERVAQGGLDDCAITLELFKRLLVDFPYEELAIIDQTVRMFSQPRLIGDEKVFYKVQLEEWTRKNQVLMELGVSERDISSNARFMALLEAEGVEIEYKTTSKGETPALAKTDYFLQELLDDASPRVAALAAARLEIKSTIEETRAGRLAAMSARGPIPVYLAYANTHTLRWAGGDKCLAADTQVLTFDPYKATLIQKRIVDVMPDDLVWDGEEFVAHEGVVFQGFREVIEHDGVEGTSDHGVWTEAGFTTLGEARERGLRLERAGEPSWEQIQRAREGHSPASGRR